MSDADPDPKILRDQRREALRVSIRRNGGISLEEYRKFFFDSDAEWQAELSAGHLNHLEEVAVPWMGGALILVAKRPVRKQPK